MRESNVERRRWTTTLAVEALAELDRISTETGEHRNEIVERLVMAAAPAPAAPAKPATEGGEAAPSSNG